MSLCRIAHSVSLEQQRSHVDSACCIPLTLRCHAVTIRLSNNLAVRWRCQLLPLTLKQLTVQLHNKSLSMCCWCCYVVRRLLALERSSSDMLTPSCRQQLCDFCKKLHDRVASRRRYTGAVYNAHNFQVFLWFLHCSSSPLPPR